MHIDAAILTVAVCILQSPGDSGVRVEWDDSRTRASLTVSAEALAELADVKIEPERVVNITIKPSGKFVPELKPLGRFKNLERLVLAHVPIDNDALPLLPELKALQVLDLRGTRVTSQGVADDISRCGSLTDLNLQSTVVTNAALPDIAKLANLKRLALPMSIQSPEFNDDLETFAALKPLKMLEELDVSGASLYDDDILPLAELPSLRRIRLKDFGGVTVEGLFELEKRSPQIRIARDVLYCLRARFALDDSERVVLITDCSAKDLTRLAKVEDLSSVRTLIIDNAVPNQLSQVLPGLEELTIRFTTITPEVIRSFAGLKNIKRCRFEECSFKVTSKKLEPLVKLKLDELTGIPNSLK